MGWNIADDSGKWFFREAVYMIMISKACFWQKYTCTKINTFLESSGILDVFKCKKGPTLFFTVENF